MNSSIKALAEKASIQSSGGYLVTVPYSDAFAVSLTHLIIKEITNLCGVISEDALDKRLRTPNFEDKTRWATVEATADNLTTLIKEKFEQ